MAPSPQLNRGLEDPDRRTGEGLPAIDPGSTIMSRSMPICEKTTPLSGTIGILRRRHRHRRNDRDSGAARRVRPLGAELVAKRDRIERPMVVARRIVQYTAATVPLLM